MLVFFFFPFFSSSFCLGFFLQLLGVLRSWKKELVTHFTGAVSRNRIERFCPIGRTKDALVVDFGVRLWVENGSRGGGENDALDGRGVSVNSLKDVDRTLDRWVQEVFYRVCDVKVVGGGGVDDELERCGGLDGLFSDMNIRLQSM